MITLDFGLRGGLGRTWLPFRSRLKPVRTGKGHPGGGNIRMLEDVCRFCGRKVSTTLSTLKKGNERKIRNQTAGVDKSIKVWVGMHLVQQLVHWPRAQT